MSPDHRTRQSTSGRFLPHIDLLLQIARGRAPSGRPKRATPLPAAHAREGRGCARRGEAFLQPRAGWSHLVSRAQLPQRDVRHTVVLVTEPLLSQPVLRRDTLMQESMQRSGRGEYMMAQTSFAQIDTVRQQEMAHRKDVEAKRQVGERGMLDESYRIERARFEADCAHKMEAVEVRAHGMPSSVRSSVPPLPPTPVLRRPPACALRPGRPAADSSWSSWPSCTESPGMTWSWRSHPSSNVRAGSPRRVVY